MGKYKRVLSLLFGIAVTVLIFVFRDSFTGLQGYGLFGLFLLSVVGNATILLPAPVILTAFVAGAVFSPFLVAPIVAFGASIGELTGYFMGYGSEELIEKESKLGRIRKWVEKYGLWTIFVMAAIPNPLFDVAGFAAGATEIPVKKYFAVVFLGKLIKFAVIAFLGSRSIILLDKFI